MLGEYPGKRKGRAISREQKCEKNDKRGGLVFEILNEVLKGGLIGQGIFQKEKV